MIYYELYVSVLFMYKVLHFVGGLYKYDLLAEYVDDVGGMIIQKDNLSISRNTSFLREEIHAILIIPSSEISNVKSLIKNIKGEIEELKIEGTMHEKLINSLKLYDILCQSKSWLNIDSIYRSIEHQDEIGLSIFDDIKKEDAIVKLEECLEFMVSLEILEKRKKNEQLEYYIIQDN